MLRTTSHTSEGYTIRYKNGGFNSRLYSPSRNGAKNENCVLRRDMKSLLPYSIRGDTLCSKFALILLEWNRKAKIFKMKRFYALVSMYVFYAFHAKLPVEFWYFLVYEWTFWPDGGATAFSAVGQYASHSSFIKPDSWHSSLLVMKTKPSGEQQHTEQ